VDSVLEMPNLYHIYVPPVGTPNISENCDNDPILRTGKKI